MSNSNEVNGTVKLKEVKHVLKCLNEQPYKVYSIKNSKKLFSRCGSRDPVEKVLFCFCFFLLFCFGVLFLFLQSRREQSFFIFLVCLLTVFEEGCIILVYIFLFF